MDFSIIDKIYKRMIDFRPISTKTHQYISLIMPGFHLRGQIVSFTEIPSTDWDCQIIQEWLHKPYNSWGRCVYRAISVHMLGYPN